MYRTPTTARPAALTALALLGVALSGCSQVTTLPDEHGGLGSNLGAMRAVITLSLQGLADQAELVAKLQGVPAQPAAGGAPAVPAVPGLTQILTAAPAANAAITANAPNVKYRTAAPPAAGAAAACSQVVVNAVGAPPSPVLPATKQKVTLVYNDASLYLEGYARGTQYYYFTDTPKCAALWTAGTKTDLGYPSTHASTSYSSDIGSVSKAIDTISMSGSAKLDVQAALDQMSFMTSEALRFSTVMTKISNAALVSKTLNPEVNKWGQASVVYATLLAGGAMPATSADVVNALRAMSTAQR